MEIPPELRRIPPKPALDWVAASVGRHARVVGVRRLHNAWATAMHTVDVDVDVDDAGDRHELVLRRYARTDIPPEPGIVENEAAALQLLATSAPALTSPRLVATDPTGRLADVPAVVMTRLPGTDVLAPVDMNTFLDGLVAALHAVHAVAVPPGTLGEYRPWGLGERDDPPPWSARPDAWRHAFAIVREPMPVRPIGLCHHDFHPGNVLWRGGRVTGIVDWTGACTGPAAADVAHCRLNLALLFGLDVAEEFSRRYGRIDDLGWFDLVGVVGWGGLDEWRWHDAGRFDITSASLARAFDEFLDAAVESLA